MPIDVARLREEFREPRELVRTSDGKTLFLRRWGSSSRRDLAVLIFHGITAYSEPYGRIVGMELAAHDVPVFGLDLRGHGRSDGRRGDYPGPERLRLDVVETLQHLRQKFRRVVVLGHSLGTLVAGLAANHRPPMVDGVVLLSCGREITPGVYRPLPAGSALRALLGIALFRGTPLIDYRREGMQGRNDPLFNFRYSARFYVSVYGRPASQVARGMREHHLDSPNLSLHPGKAIPVLVGVGDGDEIFSVEAARRFFNSLPGGDKKFFVVKGATHTIFPPGSFDPIFQWLDDHFSPSSSQEGSKETFPTSEN